MQEMDVEPFTATIPTLPPHGQCHPQEPRLFPSEAAHKTAKKCLHLPRCTTPSAIFYSNSLDLKFLLLFFEETKVSLLTTVAHPADPHVLKRLPFLQDPSYLKAFYLDPKVVEWFQTAVA